jgi:hypothetical protein
MPRGLSVIEHKVLHASAFRTLRTVLLLGALQVPMRLALDPDGCVGALRLATLVDVGLCVALVVAAVRFGEYLAANCPGVRCRAAGRWASIGLGVGALLKLVDDTLVWQRSGGSGYDACAAVTPSLTYAGWGLSGVSLVVLLVATWHSRCDYGERAVDPLRYAELRGISVEERPGTIIACSGGGIRSASFCLGALQALMSRGIYQKAAAVIGVSGGGYLAAAFHMVGRNLPRDAPPPFAQGTPELALLRRSTRYLLPRGVEVFRAVMSVLYGVAVNIANIAVALWVVAWVLGWYLHEYQVLTKPVDGSPQVFDPEGWWWAVALAPWAVAVLVFVLVEKVGDRFVSMADWRRETRTITRAMMAAGTVSVILMIAVPSSIAWLSDAEDIGAIGTALSELVAPEDREIPLTLGMVGVVATSLLTLGRSVLTGLGRIGLEHSRMERLLAVLRVRFAPWLGTLIIVAAGYVALLRLTNQYASSDAWRTDWANAVYLLAVVAGIRLLTDANRTSLHQFYRERLATAYLVERVDERTAQAMPGNRPLPVSEYAGPRPDDVDGPALVMAAVANVADEEFVPTGRGCVPFIIDATHTGVIGDRSLPVGGRTRTRDYEAFADFGRRDLTVPAAMAISGAAVSPLVGRASSRTRPVRVLLTVLNARLGVWLPNPYGQPPHVIRRALTLRRQYDTGGPDRPRRATVLAWGAAARMLSVASKPGPYRLMREAFGRPSLSDRKLYVTDGGHYDNLGLLEALRRRPRQVVVIDASNDAANSFGALAEAIATARMDLGVEVTVDVSPLQASGGERADKAWATGWATYDDSDDVTEIVFLKAQLVPNLPWDVEHYARENPDFPRRSTSRQFFDEWDFEAYRELGQDLCERMLAERDQTARIGGTEPELRSAG